MILIKLYVRIMGEIATNNFQFSAIFILEINLVNNT
jgi:hypothetical protein